MRILLVGDYPPDPRLGSTKVLVKLQEEFRALGHTCDLLLADALGSRPRNPYLRQAAAPFLARKAVERAFRARGAYDVIDVASAEGLWIARGRPGPMRDAAVIARSNGLEHLNYRRMLDDHAAGLIHKPWTRRLYHPAVRLTQVAAAARAADRLLLLNEVDRDYAVSHRWKAADRIDVVPHGVSPRFLTGAPEPRQPRGDGLLFCGSWTDVKGIAYLAAAFASVSHALPSTRLTVLGGGVPREQIAGAFAADVRDRVTVIDRTSEDEVMAAYRRHDVLAWPSTYEGFGMVLLEAMSQRLPVVATPVGAARALVADERTGLVVPPRDPQALAAALLRMLEDGPLADRCATAAFERVQPLTWTRTAIETLAVYTRALDARRNGHAHRL